MEVILTVLISGGSSYRRESNLDSRELCKTVNYSPYTCPLYAVYIELVSKSPNFIEPLPIGTKLCRTSLRPTGWSRACELPPKGQKTQVLRGYSCHDRCQAARRRRFTATILSCRNGEDFFPRSRFVGANRSDRWPATRCRRPTWRPRSRGRRGAPMASSGADSV